jgi:hypothetical protein
MRVSESISKNATDEGIVVEILHLSMRQYFSSDMLSGAAKLAERAKQIEDAHSGGPRFDLNHRAYVLSSILSSAGFLEALINELFQDAYDDSVPGRTAITPSTIAPLSTNTRRLMVEYWRSTDEGETGRTLDKYQLLLAFAGQQAIGKGTKRYQDAQLAIKLRNAIAHFRPQELSPDKPAKMEQALRPRKFAENRLSEGSDNPWWPDKCLGWGCADWSLRGAVALADYVVNAVGVRPDYVEKRAAGQLGTSLRQRHGPAAGRPARDRAESMDAGAGTSAGQP